MGLTSLWRRLAALVRRRRLERDLDDEIAFHLAMRRDELNNGHAGRRRRDRSSSSIWQHRVAPGRHAGGVGVSAPQDRPADVLFALRGFSRAPGFAVAAILVLALGIGANAAIFSLIRAILLQPLPFRDPGQLAFVRTVPPNQPDANYGATVPDYLAWRSQNSSFTSLAATWSYTHSSAPKTTARQPSASPASVARRSSCRSLASRRFAAGCLRRRRTESTTPRRSVVISERLWRRRFASDPDILGKSIRMDGRSITVIGVVNTDFQLFGDEWEFFEPFLFYNQQLQGSPRYIGVLGRLKPGVTVPAAQSDIDIIARRVAAQFPQVSTMKRRCSWGVAPPPADAGGTRRLVCAPAAASARRGRVLVGHRVREYRRAPPGSKRRPATQKSRFGWPSVRAAGS